MSDFNVVIATPSTGMCRTTYAFSLARLTAYACTTKILPEIKNWTVDYLMAQGSGISGNREDLTKQALAKPGMTHLLWIDEDMGFSHDCLHLLARWRQPIVGCNYRMRSPPADFTAMKLDRSGRIETTEQSSGLVPACYTGFGFCLIERKVLEAVPTPRYPLHWSEEFQIYSTEDMPFFHAAITSGFPCYVDQDASKKIWHCGEMNYRWNEDYTGHAAGIAASVDLVPEKTE